MRVLLVSLTQDTMAPGQLPKFADRMSSRARNGVYNVSVGILVCLDMVFVVFPSLLCKL